MSALWFLTPLPPSRHTIENEMRLAFWEAGFKQMWFTCVKDHAPIDCIGQWRDASFSVAFDPRESLTLKMKEPNQDLLKGFERVLEHRAVAAYRADGDVVVEWRVHDADARFKELQASAVKDLERLN